MISFILLCCDSELCIGSSQEMEQRDTASLMGRRHTLLHIPSVVGRLDLSSLFVQSLWGDLGCGVDSDKYKLVDSDSYYLVDSDKYSLVDSEYFIGKCSTV